MNPPLHSKPLLILLGLLILVYSATPYAELRSKNKAISNAWELPPLILNDLEGQEHNLYDWHGQVIMLNFWATWCGPCQIEIPDFINYQSIYADKGLQIIGIGLDELRKLRNYVRTVGINYPILQADPELQYSLLKQWGNPFGVLPFTVVIGKDGHFVFMQQGILNRETFDKVVKPLLAQ
ncbi:MAG: redoxin domain-containing protein [Methylomarinum sp.]|nr:redoxin domain-containing protein [Methylomarinum sp.]